MVAVMKHMASNFAKLEKFEGVDFRRWQKKMHFLLSSMSVVYVLTTPMLEDGGENPTVKQVRRRAKWDNDDYVCKGLILNANYMAEDASSKKFLVNYFTNYKMTDSRPVLEQYNKLLGILGRFTQHKINKDESIQVDSRATVHVCKDRCWFKTYKSLNDGSILHMENESTTLVHRRGCVDLRFFYVYLLHTKDEALDKFKVFKTEVELQQGYLIKRFRTDKGGERGIECIFAEYDKHSKAFRFYVIEPNDSAAISSIIESRDAIFDEHRFSSVPRLSQRSLTDGTEDSGGSVVSERVTEEGFKQNSEIDYFDTYATVARISTIRLLIAMASIHNLIIQQMDVKTAFLNGELEEEVYMNQPLGFIMPGNKNKADKCVYSKIDGSGKGVIICLYVDDMLIFGTDQVQVDLTKEFLSLRFSMKDMGDANVIFGIKIKHKSNGISISQSYCNEKVLKKFNYSDCTPCRNPLDTCKKLMPNKGPAVSQLEYSRVIGYLMYSMTCTRPDIAFDVGKLSRYTSNPGTQHWQAIQRVLKYLKKTMDYRLVYFGYPSVLEAAGKEAEWLKNLLFEIPMWVKPMAPIFIHCDSAATLAKAYSQMYNRNSRHLGVRHSMIRELITNEVVSIEFVRSQQNLADNLTKGLTRDLVIKSAEGMGLKSN
nr:zinc finger, CCHC-type [Tanacetum cinerariifolium]